MRLLLLIIFLSVQAESDKSIDISENDDVGSGSFAYILNDGSGSHEDTNTLNTKDDFEEHELGHNDYQLVDDEETSIPTKGRNDLDAIKAEKFIGPQYVVSRPQSNEEKKNKFDISRIVTDINEFISFFSAPNSIKFPKSTETEGGDGDGATECSCDCPNKYQYAHDDKDDEDSKNDDEGYVEVILKSDKYSKTCTENQYRKCCKSDTSVQPRFRFPEINPKLPELHISEEILVTKNLPEEPATSTQPTTQVSLQNEDSYSTFSHVDNSSQLNTTVRSMAQWFIIMDLEKPVDIKMTLSSRGQVALLAKRGDKPMLKMFDIMDTLNGLTMETYSVKLHSGIWYFRLSNEENFDQEMLLTISQEPISDLESACCEENCKKINGITLCQKEALPCENGERHYNGCKCFPNWIGTKCEISMEECSSAYCSGSGTCVLTNDTLGYKTVSCKCNEGYTGSKCEILKCESDCGSNGICSEGQCKCFEGFTGPTCNSSSSVSVETFCLDSLLQEQGTCIEDCGEQAECINGECQCLEGFYGPKCEFKTCDPRCSYHGTCHDGDCTCDQGWQGSHCTLDGCPNACNGNGKCQKIQVQLQMKKKVTWSCQCNDNWTGEDCGIQLENVCDDGIDNDGDGLEDCEDPECCYSDKCSTSQYCKTVPDPSAVINLNQEPHHSDNFFEKYKFLIQEGSLQRFAKLEQFDLRKVSVIRGRVLTPSGQGLRGVRVSNGLALREGFTLTRTDGYFDLLVTGGSSIKVKFGKTPFPYQSKYIFVPQNQIVVMENVHLKMSKERSGRAMDANNFCEEHASFYFNPKILVIDSSSRNSETYLTENVHLEPSKVSLVHSGVKQNSYIAAVKIQVLDKLPKSLLSVKTRIIVEGRVFEDELEAEAYLNSTFKWDGYNVYGYKHYGYAYVNINIGLKYKLCHDIIWKTIKVKIHGHTPLSTNIGGWDLNIHHVYNNNDGIIYKGDGDIIELDKKEKIVKAVNENFSQTIISPVAVVIGHDDSLYVGDLKYIRHIDINNKVTNILQLNESTTNHKYYLALSMGRTEYLIMSDPVNKRILKIPTKLSGGRTILNNFEILIGNHDCDRYEQNCNDGDDPLKMSLVYPKGVATTADNEHVFVDGSTIKMYNVEEKVVTIAGLDKAATDWKPSKCSQDVRAMEANFNWPTEIAVNYVNDDITIIDQGSIFQLTKDGRVIELYSSTCPNRFKMLNYAPKTLTYSHNGDLFIVDEKNIIHKLDMKNSFDEVAGSMSYCKRSLYGCLQSDFDEVITVGSKARFQSISSIAMSSDGTLFITDLDKHHIRSISTHKPELNDITDRYEYISSETEEIYFFDKKGRHKATKGLYISTSTGFEFLYLDNHLNEVYDRYMNKINLEIKDGYIKKIAMSNGKQYHFKINKYGHLDQIISPHGLVTMYKYSDKGLMQRKLIDRKLQFLYQYSAYGNLLDIESMVPIQSLDQKNVHENSTEILEEQNELLQELYGYEAKFNPINVGLEEKINAQSVHRVKWEYFMHSARTRSSFGINVDGVGKKLIVNDEVALTSELHPRSMIRSLYDQNGIQMLKVEEYGVPKRTILIPKAPFHAVDQTYDENGRLLQWSRGEMIESLEFDSFGRLLKKEDCMATYNFSYLYSDSFYPNKRGQYVVQLDNSGGMEYVMTPSQNKHLLNLSPKMGMYILTYKAPWSSKKIYITIGNAGSIISTEQETESRLKKIYQIDENEAQLACMDFKATEMVTNDMSKRYVKSQAWEVSDDTLITQKNIKMLRKITNNNNDLSVHTLSCNFNEINHSLLCNQSMGTKTWSSNYHFNKINNKVTIANNFELVKSSQSYAWINKETNIIIKMEFDGFGRISRREVTIGNKIVFTSASQYNCKGQITKISEVVGNKMAKIQNFQYVDHGIKSVDDGRNWIFNYDENGNIIRVDFDKGNVKFEYEAGERINKVEGRDSGVSYSESGAMIHRDGYTFVYNCNNQLVKILYSDRVRKELVYDAIGRPVMVVDHIQGFNISLIYNLQEERSWEVTAWIREDEISLVTYDNRGHIMSMKKDDDTLIVITDHAKTPYLVFSDDGNLLKEQTYSPFGALVDDTNEDLQIPIGYHGGIDPQETGIVIIEGRPYDSLLGQWMVPDVDSILSLPHKTDITDIHLYRFKKNDPQNCQNKKYMTTLNEWMSFFDYNIDTIQRSILHSAIFKGLKIPKMTQVPQQVSNNILDANVQKILSLDKETRDINIARSFHLSSPIFPNVILSRHGDTLHSLAVEGASPVEIMIAGLMNMSTVLDNYGGDLETIYFVKHGGFEEETIKKLKKYLKIEERQIPPFGKEICFSTSRMKLCGLSGVESVEREHLKDTFQTGPIVSETQSYHTT